MFIGIDDTVRHALDSVTTLGGAVNVGRARDHARCDDTTGEGLDCDSLETTDAAMMKRVALLLLAFTSAARAFSMHPLCVVRSHEATSSASHSRSLPAVAMAKAKKKGGSAKGGNVQVVLTADVKSLGKKGDVVSVKPAYAENAIVRAGLGKMATEEILEQIAADDAAAVAAAAAAKAAAEEAATKLVAAFGEDGKVLKKSVGPDGAIFGKITPTEVADLVQEVAGITVEKKNINAPALKVRARAASRARSSTRCTRARACAARAPRRVRACMWAPRRRQAHQTRCVLWTRARADGRIWHGGDQVAQGRDSQGEGGGRGEVDAYMRRAGGHRQVGGRELPDPTYARLLFARAAQEQPAA